MITLLLNQTTYLADQIQCVTLPSSVKEVDGRSAARGRGKTLSLTIEKMSVNYS